MTTTPDDFDDTNVYNIGLLTIFVFIRNRIASDFQFSIFAELELLPTRVRNENCFLG